MPQRKGRLVSLGVRVIVIHFVASDAIKLVQQNVYQHGRTGQYFMRYQKLWRRAILEEDKLYHVTIKL